MQPIQVQIFNWSSRNETYSDRLKSAWFPNFDVYVLLECLARQLFVRKSGYLFGVEAESSEINLGRYAGPKKYEDEIHAYIREIEAQKREQYNNTLVMVDEINNPNRNDILFYRKFGRIDNHPVILNSRRDENRKLIKPNEYLEYGKEKVVFWKILRDIEDIVPTESDFKSDQDKFDGVSKKYLRETKTSFGSGVRDPGRYMSEITRKDYGSVPVEIFLHPDKHDYFRFFIGAYYGVFHSFFSLGEEYRADLRTGFDRFLAEKFEYMMKDASAQLAQHGFDVNTLYSRETIKDRIKGNPEFFDEFKAEAFKTLINNDFLKYLENRNQS